MRFGWPLSLGVLGAVSAAAALIVSDPQNEGAPAETAGPPAGYPLVPSFVDEFDGPTLDRRSWGHVYADPSSRSESIAKRTLPANRERQVYVDKDYLALGIDPFEISDGILTITARPLAPRELNAVMMDVARQEPHQPIEAMSRIRYSSGLVTARGKFVQRYGYFEARMRWTGGRGVWPAWWLLREDSHWPPEIDIMEAIGGEPQTIFSSIHSKFEPRNKTVRVPLKGDPAQFHRYGALWLPDRIDFYVDGQKTGSLPTTADMDRPMYPLFNLAIGGNWPGDPDSSTTMPARLDVDYVRIWRLADKAVR